MQGKRFLAPAGGQPWPLTGFTPQEQPDPAARFPEYLPSGFAKLGDVFDPAWPGGSPSARELDRTTLAGYMRGRGASATWLDWFFAQEGSTYVPLAFRPRPRYDRCWRPGRLRTA